MNPWPFVIAAYGLTLVPALLLTVQSIRAMRRAEKRAAELGRGA